MIEILQFLSRTSSQGWVLTFFSSIICIFGTLIIYFDDIYYFIFPKSITSRYKFKLKENYSFLNGSLALSSGCLIITSLYRLLPEAHKYLLKSQENTKKDEEEISKKYLQFYLMISYFGGILICLFFNFALHLLTSESIVHCNHGNNVKGEDEEEINHHYDGHHHSHNNNNSQHNHQHSHSHNQKDHSHSHSHSEDLDSNINLKDDTSSKPSRVDDPNSADIQEYFPPSAPQEHNHSVHMEVRDHENTPLIRKTLKPRKSLIQMFLSHHENEETSGECKGYSSAELCTYKNHEHSNNSQDKLHFCEIPQLTNNDSNEDGSTEVEDDDESQRHNQHDQHHHQNHQQNEVFHSNQSHHSHEIDHHHHVNSPLSRLLLIGIQTTLAITLHKLPEGFITYITSETNPKLGISIFISLVLHNFTEGFSMCLPLYYSMSQTSKFAKLKAVLISSLLGGLSQPAGAFLGYLFLKFNSKNYNLQNLNFIFGLTMSLTSGFLTVISLSMYGSAVSFGGDMNFVMIWCIIGIMVIGLSTIFSS
ncbi:ZRT3 [Candida jiufengensis]|uniref:ZRT3 n=1 Tax=Candida jiufengensis TaxID=497108 RepID=UPI002224F372|nr:ZRT3 [Candida jiufengensis]KAI5951443.1 ZRT3 [Candida jiufengensis]